ncbi:MAG: hypothetical protein V3R98_04745, partial [Alphaproteobacteria bacterium]
ALSPRQGRNAARRDAVASGKRRDAPCRGDSAALRVAFGRPARFVEGLDRSVATLFDLLLAARTARTRRRPRPV